MKKIILTTFLVIATLGLTSCNKSPEPIVYSDQFIFTVEIADIMRNGLVEVFGYEEIITTKIANEEQIDPGITVNKDDLDNVTGWEVSFANLASPSDYFKGKITVNFTGDPLADGSIKEIDCSEMSVYSPYLTLKLFGTITIENQHTSATETVRKVTTNSFGWGETANDVYLNADYTFTTTYSSSQMTECKISGSASGYHQQYKNFSQEIISTLNVGANVYFTSGAMLLYALGIGDGIFPIDVVFSQNNISITYNGETTVW